MTDTKTVPSEGNEETPDHVAPERNPAKAGHNHAGKHDEGKVHGKTGANAGGQAYQHQVTTNEHRHP